MPQEHLTSPLAIWRAYNDASNAGDHDRAARYAAPGVQVELNGAPSPGTVEQDLAIKEELFRCFPDFVRDFVRGYECGDQATIEWLMRGRAAPGVELPPLQVPGCSIVQCRDGRIVAARLYRPTGVMDQVAERVLSG